MGLAFELDMRYRGQAYNLTVPLDARPVTAGTVAAAERAFADAHRRAYDYTPSVTETEIVTVRARATGRVATRAMGGSRRRPGRRAGGPRGVDRTAAGASSPWWTATASPARDAVAARTIVEQEDATVVIPDGWTGVVGDADVLVLEREGP